jgi:hypothetical protein
MSTAALQSAIVELIRSPDSYRGKKLTEFLDRFDLTDKEKWRVRAAAGDHNLKKFGKDQRKKRFTLSVRNVLPWTIKRLGLKIAAEEIYFKHFEPEHPGLGVTELGHKYADFLLEHPELFDKYELPEFSKDLLKYEINEFTVNHNDIQNNWTVPEGSLLSPKAPFKIVDLEWDIVSYIEEVKASGKDIITSFVPEKRPVTLLLVKVPKPDEYEVYLSEQFEIDASLKDFLLSQLEGKSDAPLPECYNDLVELGLCRPLQ